MMVKYTEISNQELLHRCSAYADVGAWEEFIRRFHRPIAAVVIRTASRWETPTKQIADDLIQETYLKLCENNYRILRDFNNVHPEALPAYLKTIAANLVRDHFKSAHRKKRGGNQLESIPDDSVPPAAEESHGGRKAMERAVLMQEVQRHLDQCIAGADRDRNNRIFWLHYRVGLSAAAIAVLPGVGLTAKGVESLILRMTRQVRLRIADTDTEKQRIPRRPLEGFLNSESS